MIGRWCFSPGRRRGVALLTALLAVFLASALAVRLAILQQTAIQRGAAVERHTQLLGYLLGAEQWALAVLARDRRDDGGRDTAVDHLDEPWARLAPSLSLPGGALRGSLSDLQGRLNVNNLAAERSAAERSLVRLRRLLTLIEFDPQPVDALADWIDPDQAERLGGAEDGVYAIREPAYLSANRPLADLSELRLIGGVDAALYRRLLPLLSALPTPTPVNVNTAPAEVLAALADGLDLNRAAALVKRRDEQPFASVAEFWHAARLAPGDVSGDNLAVSSDYFLLRVQVTLGNAQARLSSVLWRGDAASGLHSGRVVARSFGTDTD